MAAALSIQDVRERPLDKEAKADQAHRPVQGPPVRFRHHPQHLAGNPQTVADRPRSMNALKKVLPAKHFLSFRRIREWRDIHRQISCRPR
jgi:ATP-dependent helicase HrpA